MLTISDPIWGSPMGHMSFPFLNRPSISRPRVLMCLFVCLFEAIYCLINFALAYTCTSALALESIYCSKTVMGFLKSAANNCFV